jgi:predicted DNA-binding transcriptional regulator AlpA
MSTARQEARDQQPEYVRTRQAAKKLGLSPATIYNYRAKPELEFPVPKRLYGAVLYSVADLDAWMEKRKSLAVKRAAA